MLESAAMRPHRHPRVGGDPLVFKVFKAIKVKMDSRFRENDGEKTGMTGRVVVMMNRMFNE